jgi:hypothetical protein
VYVALPASPVIEATDIAVKGDVYHGDLTNDGALDTDVSLLFPLSGKTYG